MRKWTGWLADLKVEVSHAMQQKRCIPDPLEWVALGFNTTQLHAALHILHTVQHLAG